MAPVPAHPYPAPLEVSAPEPDQPQPPAREPAAPAAVLPDPHPPAEPSPDTGHAVAEAPPLRADAVPSIAASARHAPGEPAPRAVEGNAAASLVFVRADAAPPAAMAQAAVPDALAPPSSDGLGRALAYLRLALKAAAAVVVALTVLVLALVVVYRWVDPPASTLMLAQRFDGVEVQQDWVPLGRMSPHLVRAVVVSEDSGFCRHRGVDWGALVEAMESQRGGSTITMQVVKNLFLWPSRSYVRKAIEIALACLVEALWPKERILEIYLNIAEWGDGLFGAEAAARHHFGVPAARLTVQEAALLAVSLPNPFEREAGAPGPGTQRLAGNLLVRMKTAPAAAACVQLRRGGT
jgi:monofunctional biosynthetic peptidoglycan transglycosylase